MLVTERTDETRDDAEQPAGTEAETAADTPAAARDDVDATDGTATIESQDEEAAEPEVLPEHLQNVVDALQKRYPDLDVIPKADDWLEVNIGAEQASDFFSFIKESPGLAFDYLSDLTAVDYEDKGFQIVYHLISMGIDVSGVGRKLVIKIDVPRDNPHAPTAVNVWPTANFHEREVYDMFGVVFDGHPDLRRILMPENWVGHPLRKDYVDKRPERPRVVKKQ